MAEATVGVLTPASPDRLIDNVRMPNGDGTQVYRQRVAVGPVLHREIRDYGARLDGQPVYLGFNAQEADTNDETWVVHKRFYDATDRLIDTQVQVGIAWSDRATAGHWRGVGGD